MGLSDQSPTIQGATDNTEIGNVGDALKVTGTLTVTPSSDTLTTYSASASGFVPAAAATDVFRIQGSATKTIKITRIAFSITTTAGSGGLLSVGLIKRSANNTGGTSVTATNTPHDSNNAAATAVVNHYTANPSALGTSVGMIRCIRAEAYNTAITASDNVWTFGDRPGQTIVLRGTSQYLCLNFGGGTITGPIACANVEWTEES